ncbi:MAG TPA: trigger factor [Trueperaceae bacterium]|nr:trigger factor [Trueperaceae bacterium]
MEARVVEKQGVSVTVNVRVDADTVDAAFERVLTSLSRTVKVPGFRPGKAPRGVLEKRVGEEVLAQEVRDALVDESYPDAMKELELFPIDAHFHADGAVRGQEFEYTVHADVYPDVELPDLASIKLDTQATVVSDADVDEAIKRLGLENATLVPVERPVEDNDWLLVGHVTGDEQADEASTFPIHLDRAGDELKGQLLGKSIGDIVDVSLTDTNVEDEAGNPVVSNLKLRVVDVKGKELPADDDELGMQLGFTTGAELRERVRESLEADARRSTQEARRDEVVNKLVAGSKLDLPASLVRRRQRTLLQDVVQDLSQQGVTLQRYLDRLEERGKREEFEKELTESAENGVRRDLVLERLMEVRGTDVTDVEYQAAIKTLAESRGVDVGRLERDMGADYLANYRFFMRRDKALREFIAELSGEEVVAADEYDLEDAAEAADLVDDELGDEHEHEHHHDHGDHEGHGH